MLPIIDKKDIYSAFVEGSLEVKSVTKDCRIEWRRVSDVTRHSVLDQTQHRLGVEGEVSCTATGSHSLFKLENGFINEIKTGMFNVGDRIVCVDGDTVVEKLVLSNLVVPPEEYMYDLTVEENENFVLKSGILAHNTFRPPSSEKFIQSQTQVFGYIWTDEELYEYLLMAVDDFNSAPPATGITLETMADNWRTLIAIRAAAFACMGAAMTWIVNEFNFSISGVSLDIDKSSKYESMKQNFESEWDKARDLAKRTIKIVRGLSQPRYGIGISSALGPMSKPGVQSRRSWVSGGM